MKRGRGRPKKVQTTLTKFVKGPKGVDLTELEDRSNLQSSIKTRAAKKREDVATVAVKTVTHPLQCGCMGPHVHGSIEPSDEPLTSGAGDDLRTEILLLTPNNDLRERS